MFAVNKTHFSPGTGQQTRGSLGTGSGLKRAPGLAGGLLLVAPGAWREGEVRLSLSPASVQEPPRQTGAMAPDRRGTWQFWLLRCQKLAKQSHRIIEYPKSEGTHKDHQAQVLAPRRTTQKTDPVLRALSKCSWSSGSLVSPPLPQAACDRVYRCGCRFVSVCCA